MKPIALSFKNYEINPFTGRGSGELIIVHRCLNCGQISPNRIAGDDNEYQILSILEESFNLSVNQINSINVLGINLVTKSHKEDVLISLFGINYQKYF